MWIFFILDLVSWVSRLLCLHLWVFKEIPIDAILQKLNIKHRNPGMK